MPEQRFTASQDDSIIPHVGSYRRELPVNLERMYENTLDWEHLPHVHRSSFTSIEAIDYGAWGWRARVTNANGSVSELELRLDRQARRWITRNVAGPNVGAEIWTHVFTVDEQRIDIVVDFFVPGVAAQDREKVGGAYARAYERLYDEDVAMMVERQRQLNRRLQSPRSPDVLDLGPVSSLVPNATYDHAGRQYRVAEVDGQWFAYPSTCPHQLGPLDPDSLDSGIVTCAWHGYRFDLRSGNCVSGQNCQFSQRPQVHLVDGHLQLSS